MYLTELNQELITVVNKIEEYQNRLSNIECEIREKSATEFSSQTQGNSNFLFSNEDGRYYSIHDYVKKHIEADEDVIKYRRIINKLKTAEELIDDSITSYIDKELLNTLIEW